MGGTRLETVVVAVAELFPRSGSTVEELTDAVLVITAPSATKSFTRTSSVKTSIAPAGSEPVAQLTTPVSPTAGTVHDHAGGAERE
jgi:hypothetical protein